MSKTMKFPLPQGGVDMLSEETSLLKGCVRSAVNVDIGRQGDFRRRAGRSLLVAGDGFHSLYHFRARDSLVVARGAQLFRLFNDGMLRKIFDLNSPDVLSYCEHNGALYFVSKTTTGWLPADSGAVRRMNTDVPPGFSAMEAAGSLHAGAYRVTLSFVDEFGQESGTCDVQQVRTTTGGLRLVGLPVDPTRQIRIYLSDCDSEILREHETIPAAYSTYVLGGVATGGECRRLHLRAMPPGQLIAAMAGRVYVASGSTLYFSRAYEPTLLNPTEDFVQFSGEIRLLITTGTGVFVGDDRGVWFLQGTDPTQFRQLHASPARAVRGSGVVLDAHHVKHRQVAQSAPVALWLSTAGYMAGLEDGRAVALNEDRIALPEGLTGRTTLVLRNGMKQVITAVNSPITAAPGAATDSPNW